ncbi:MAG: cell division protein ZapA [Pseudomonadota bacterium]|nr:cell division protein ZapA [Pseudomonadota bacterium]
MQKQITILGRSYTLRADEDDDLEHAAADVDRRLRALIARAPSFDSYTTALLTALNLASELRALKVRYRTRLEELDHAAAAVEAVLEAAVAEDSDAGDTGPEEPT